MEDLSTVSTNNLISRIESARSVLRVIPKRVTHGSQSTGAAAGGVLDSSWKELELRADLGDEMAQRWLAFDAEEKAR